MASPYQTLFHKAPDYHFLKTFGYACYPLVRPYRQHKLDFCSDLCLFLGYSEQHKDYKCLSPTGKTYISKNVIFDESLFPYTQYFTKEPGSATTTSLLPYSPTLIPQIPLITPTLSQNLNSSLATNTHPTAVTNDITNSHSAIHRPSARASEFDKSRSLSYS